MKRRIIKGIVLFLAGITLLSVRPAEARRVKDVTRISSSIQKTLAGIGYEQESDEISALITEVFPNLDKLRSLSTEEKINGLAQMIKDKIKAYDDGVFELPDVLKGKDGIRCANCFGYAQLFYVLGKELGLDVEVIDVYPGHTANLIKLDSGYVILDLAIDGGYYKSKVFNWDDNYRKEAAIWCLKEGSQLPQDYRIMQRLDEQGMVAVRYDNRGTVKGKLGLYKESITDFDIAIGFNPNDAAAYCNRAISKANLGLNREAIIDYDRAIKLNPYDAIAYFGSGASKGKLGLHEKEIRDYNRAIELNPDYALAYYNRGLAKYYFFHQASEALVDLKEAIRIKPELYDQLPRRIQDLLKSAP